MTLVFGLPISGGETSIGEQARAGDVAGFGTRQIGDKAGDLIGIAIALKRCDGNQRLREVAVCWIHVSINRAGWTSLTVMPRGPRSLASPFVKPATAPFVSA